MIIESNDISAHSSTNGTEFFTIVPGVHVRRDDLIHHAGRKYAVQRVERHTTNGCTVVRANYRTKL